MGAGGHRAVRPLAGKPIAARAVAAGAAVVALYAAQVWATNDSAHGGPRAGHVAIMLGTGLLQSLALLALYRALHGAAIRRARMFLAVGVAVMLLLSAACTNTDDDAAAYVAYAKLPTAASAYAPPPDAYSGNGFDRNGFDVIPKTWPELPPLVYGPVWLGLDRLVAGRAPTYAMALALLRGANALYLIGLLVALRRLGFGAATLAVAALNPMLYFYFIVQAHNDLLAILLVAAGMVIARRRPVLGALVAGAAGLVKIAFMPIAVLAYAGRLGARTTIALFAGVSAAAVAISALAGGAPYFRAMAAVGHTQIATRTDTLHLAAVILHAGVALVAAGALGAAVLRNAYAAPAAYSFSAISTIGYPWYLGWCIPYALRVPGFAALFFIWLPAIAHAIDPHFALLPQRTFALLVPYDLAIIVLVALHLRRALRANPTAVGA